MIQWTIRARLMAGIGGLVVVVAALLAVRGCIAPRADLDTVAKRIDAGELATAIVELKALLQADPASAEARLLLGRAYLAAGDAASAQAEIERASAAGMPVERWAPPMVEALVAQRKEQDAIQRYTDVKPGDAATTAALRAQLARAHVAAGDIERARAEVAASLAAVPEYGPARLVQARLAAGSGKAQEALTIVDAVLARTPRDAAAWALKADLLRVRDRTSAIDAYRRALELNRRSTEAHGGLVGLMLQSDDLAAARQQWAELSKALPNNGLTWYLDALLALREQRPERARAAAQSLLKSGAESAQVLVVAGQAEYALGAYSQAEALFRKATLVAPGAATPRHQLAATLLRQGQAERALTALQPLIGASSADGIALGLAAKAYVLLSDFKRAEAAFARAEKLSPDNAALRTERAVSSLAMGRTDAALADLQTIASQDKGMSADMALLSTRLQRKEYQQALQIVDRLESKGVAAAQASDLRAQIALLRNDRVAARAGLEQALAKDARYYPAVERLAMLDLADGKPAQARRRYEAVLDVDPVHVAALQRLVGMAGLTLAELRALLPKVEKAVAAHPASAEIRQASIDLLIRMGETSAALSSAQSAAAALPADPGLLERLASLQQRSGERNQALATLRKLAAAQPNSARARLLLADALRAQGLTTEADKQVQAALAAEPESVAAVAAAAALAQRQGDPARALALVREVQSRQPAEAIGFVLEGDLLSSQGQSPAAVAAYAKALQKQAPGVAPIRYHRALRQTKGDADARRFQQDWLRDHPTDVAYRLFLAELATGEKDDAAAETQLRKLIELAPDNAQALNNLAHLLWRQRKPEARALAERAVSLAPGVPAYLDTLAAILADAQQLEQALQLQSRAVALAPNSGSLRLGLVKILLRKGDKDRARTELAALAGLGPSFAGQAEVAALRRELGDVSPPAAAEAGQSLPKATAVEPPAPTATGRSNVLIFWAALASIALIGVPLLLAAAAMGASSYRVERSVSIGAAAAPVYDALQDLSRWPQWCTFEPFEAGATRELSARAAGPGASLQWRAGRGEASGTLELLRAGDGAEVAVELVTILPREARQLVEFFVDVDGPERCRVRCVARGRARYIDRLLALARVFGIAHRTERRLASSLQGLKTVVEAESASVDGRQGEPAVA